MLQASLAIGFDSDGYFVSITVEHYLVCMWRFDHISTAEYFYKRCMEGMDNAEKAS